MPKRLDYYVGINNRTPFLEWMNSLDIKNQAIVDRMLQRVACGGAKKSVKYLKDGVFEIKIPHASGLRVYFGEERSKLILLLSGGDKASQNRDIKKAKYYWSQYGKQK